MDPEHVMTLFDSYWFNHEILKNNPDSHKRGKSEVKFSSLRSILSRSQSDHNMGKIRNSSFNYGPFSPNSVLKTQKQEHEKEEEIAEVETVKNGETERKKSGNYRSKSLSELEFEELKGFMDMGFVFSEQDKDSSLVEIIPGLQRIGEERKDEEDDNDDDGNGDCNGGCRERRPYLSEAWIDLDRKRAEKVERKKAEVPLMINWKIPAVSDEIDLKDNLKLWAHTVASFVR